jgi:hypothetical protein
LISLTVSTLSNSSVDSPHNLAKEAKCIRASSVTATLQPSPSASKTTSDRCIIPINDNDNDDEDDNDDEEDDNDDDEDDNDDDDNNDNDDDDDDDDEEDDNDDDEDDNDGNDDDDDNNVYLNKFLFNCL